MNNSEVCKMVGCEFPLFAFTHCRDVVVAVSKAGGFGVLGGSSFTPEQLETELQWIDAHIGGMPYGVDILVPENMPALTKDITAEQLASQVPQAHKDFIVDLLGKHDINVTDEDVVTRRLPATMSDIGEELMDVAFNHPIKLIANALGIAPASMIERGRKHGVPVAALVGAKEHALRQANAGVDIIVAQGSEAGGHCGEVSTLVLIPEVVKALKAADMPKPVLAAGGIMTGKQMAGMMAMGAAGAWTGSVWLATPESETIEVFRNKMVAASSRDTVRAKNRTGKPSRQLRSAWHDAWDNEEGIDALPMPLMGIVSKPAFAHIDKAAESGNEKAVDLVSYWVGQGVGLIDGIRSSGQVVQDFKEDFAESIMAMQALFDE